MKGQLLIAFYGDDFTGSTDALEFLCSAGAKAILFMQPPTLAQLADYPGINAIGVAGKTRSMPPDQMEQVLQTAFEQIKTLHPQHVHYKVCSTFDSSPAIGSIGKAIETGAAIFKRNFIPLLVAAPSLGRYCVFGNLFAKMGIGSKGNIFRLDRHPSMRMHPVTPANESDLMLHLAQQTTLPIELIDILQLSGAQNVLQNNINQRIAHKETIVLFDTLNESDLLPIGELMDAYATNDTLFSVGSSGVEMALGMHWKNQKIIEPVTQWPNLEKAKPLLVLSGSCSPVTAAQIVWAKENGFAEVIIDAISINIGLDLNPLMQTAIVEIVRFLQQQKSVIVHTGDKQLQNLSSEKIGSALGLIAKEVVSQSVVKRIVMAGGDTSSYAATAMLIDALEMIAPLVLGAPMCKAISTNTAVNGIEINFKGGQVGAENYFGQLQEGKL